MPGQTTIIRRSDGRDPNSLEVSSNGERVRLTIENPLDRNATPYGGSVASIVLDEFAIRELHRVLTDVLLAPSPNVFKSEVEDCDRG
jgi:hypothetical protein